MANSASLVGSGVLILALGVFHSAAGEKYLVRRLLRWDNLPHLFGDDSFTQLTIRYAWHLITILCVAFLFYAAHETTHAAVAAILSVAFLACGVWVALATRGRHLSWVIVIVAGLLAGLCGRSLCTASHARAM